MFNFPFLGYPYNYNYYRYYNRYNPSIKDTTNNTNSEGQEKNKEEKDSITNSKEISNTINSISYLNSTSDSDQAIFEIFGIKLYLDDLIIIGLLFFLYQQNVNDEMLYMILFLLLFS